MLTLIFLVGACAGKKEKKGPVVVVGEVHNYKRTKAKFSYRPYTLFSSLTSTQVDISRGGSFKLKIIDIEAPLRGFFSFGKVPASYKIHVKTPSGKDSTFTQGTNDFRLVYLYLQPGDSVHMEVDAAKIPESLSFTGKHAENSTYINVEDKKFDSYQDKVLNNSYNIITWGPEKYEQIINNQKQQKLDFLDKYTSSHAVSDHLKEVYKWKYYADAATAKIYYKMRRDGFLKESVRLPSDYYDFMNEMPLAEKFNDKGIGYFYFLDSYLKKEYELKKGHKPGREDFYQFVKKQVGGKRAYEYLAFALGRDFNRTLYDEFDKDCPYPQIAQLVKKNYKHLEGMLAGSPAPNVKLTNMSGKKIPLSKFKGQYIYLDFWATWCKPCIEEIPSLEKLKKEYKDKNIKFISISFDYKKDVEKWKKFVHNRHLTGAQYWADPKNNDKFSKAFNIKMIPRFVLIDDQGKIVDANAPRPSEKRVKTLLKNNL